MARSLWIECFVALYHVTARGSARQRFLVVPARVASRSLLLLHAYRLMDNHFYLVAPPEADLSNVMRQLI
jgi:hypothetical protein